jgi:hypothetical protein
MDVVVPSSFFWLLSILLTSIVWYVLVPLRTHYWFIVPFAVLLQEAMRWVFFKLYAYVHARSSPDPSCCTLIALLGRSVAGCVRACVMLGLTRLALSSALLLAQQGTEGVHGRLLAKHGHPSLSRLLCRFPRYVSPPFALHRLSRARALCCVMCMPSCCVTTTTNDG